MFESAELVDLSEPEPPPSSAKGPRLSHSRRVSPLLVSSPAHSIWKPLLPTPIVASPNPRLVPLPSTPLSRSSISPAKISLHPLDVSGDPLVESRLQVLECEGSKDSTSESFVDTQRVKVDADRETLSDLIGDMSRSREKLRAALAEYMYTSQQEMGRMRIISGVAEDSLGQMVPALSGGGSGKAVIPMETEILSLRKTNQRLEQECKEYQAQWTVHLMEKAQWEAQKAVLGQRHVRLLVEHDRLRQRVDEAQWSHKKFGVVLLEGEARMFHPNDLAAVYDGGVRVARRIRDRIHEIWNLASKQGPLAAIVIHLYIDIPKVREELLQTDSNFHDFLDGINEQDPLNSVVDVTHGAPMADKIRAQLSQAFQSIQCPFILIGGPYHSYGLQHPQSAFNPTNEKIYAIKNRVDDDRWQSAIGVDKVIPIPSLYPYTPEEWKQLGARYQGTLERPSATPSVPKSSLTGEETQQGLPARTPQPRTPPPPQTRTPSANPPWRIAAIPGARDLLDQVEVLPSARAWNGHQGSAQKQSHEARGDPSTPAASLLDQYYTERANGQSREPGQITHPLGAPNIPMDSMFKWSGIDQIIQQPLPDAEGKLVIPVDIEIEGSVLGSPPESDEDEPSVDVPHSAKSFVQRPTIVVERNDDFSSDTASCRSGSTTRPSRSLTSSVAPSILSSTATPAASRSATPVATTATANLHPLGIVLPSCRPSSHAHSLDLPPHMDPHLGVIRGRHGRSD